MTAEVKVQEKEDNIMGQSNPCSSITNETERNVPRQEHRSDQMPAVESIICRICHNYERVDRLISPCFCKGTLNYVHRNCLEYWLSRANILHCELCMYQFETTTVLRYKCCEAIRLWYRHPNNRGLLQADALICSLMTFLTFILTAMSLYGLKYFLAHGGSIGISKFWTHGSVTVFLIVIMLAYIINVTLILRAQITPWYRWWKSTKIVRLIIPDVRPTNQTEIESERVEVVINPNR